MSSFNMESISNQLCAGLSLKLCSPHHYQIVSDRSKKVILDIWPTKRKFLAREAGASTVVGTEEQLLKLVDRLYLDGDVQQPSEIKQLPTNQPLFQPSLLNYFAGQALQGWLASYSDQSPHPGCLASDAEAVARWSFNLAQAMIDESKRNN